MSVEQLVEWELAGETEENNATLSTKNPTLPDLGSILGCCGGNPAAVLHSVGLCLIGFAAFRCCFESIYANVIMFMDSIFLF
jgi:hypothetical protein